MSHTFASPIHEWFERVWNRGEEHAIDQLMDAECLSHGLGEPLRGPDSFKQFWRAYRGAFPNITVEVLDTVKEGDKFAARCLVRGTHSGDHLGLAPTQRDIAVPLFGIARFKDGKMVEVWNHYPVLEMQQQLGVI